MNCVRRTTRLLTAGIRLTFYPNNTLSPYLYSNKSYASYDGFHIGGKSFLSSSNSDTDVENEDSVKKGKWDNEQSSDTETSEDDEVPYGEITDEEEEHFNKLKRDLIIKFTAAEKVLVLQPIIKRGAHREKLADVELKLAEAAALVETLPKWFAYVKMICPVEYSTKREMVFGFGKIMELRAASVKMATFTVVFVNVDLLQASQHQALTEIFELPVYDRYNIVLQIFRTYARTEEAKLQIALAEINYLRRRLRLIHTNIVTGNIGGIPHILPHHDTNRNPQIPWEERRFAFKRREAMVKKQLEEVKLNRQAMREERSIKMPYPVVAVVGYTNSGKTSLIKCLTTNEQLVPMDRLFATIGVTAHAGVLPKKTIAVFIDTVGFIRDIPLDLIASFRSTLEDIRHADLVIHVRDLSHPHVELQKQTVLKTLKSLELPPVLLENIVEVCNKVDISDPSLIPKTVTSESLHFVSCSKGWGLLPFSAYVERKLISIMGAAPTCFKLPMDCNKYLEFLEKETAVQNITPSDDANYLYVDSIASPAAKGKFKAYFGSEFIVQDSPKS